ncbi:hypothetical protein AB0L40_03495 [Patulibacter sp. NPDC049589]|uniref:hypothetical protein n=1 Tax=Patulibacter sp. NPDC049589 TaxID=3154731 RepID=UPI0034345B0D
MIREAVAAASALAVALVGAAPAMGDAGTGRSPTATGPARAETGPPRSPTAARPLVVAPAATPRAAASSGPALTVPAAELAVSLNCRGDLAAASRPPVLLAPDYATSEQSYGWNLARQLPAVGVPVCTLDLEHPGTEDLQDEAEHVVHAVREMRARSGRPVVLVGHAFIALAERWAVTFWPDVAASVSDVVGIAAPDQGTELTAGLCSGGRACPPSAWQATPGSAFLRRINRDPLPTGEGGLAFTTISSRFDELVSPQPRASTLPGARNIALQDVCPNRPSDHFAILGDAITYRLLLDAIDHPGPADPSRLPAGACGEAFLPGLLGDVVNLKVPIALAGFLTSFPAAVGSRGVAAEPPLRAYARTPAVYGHESDGAGITAPPRPGVRVLTRRVRVGASGTFALRVRCTTTEPACALRTTVRAPVRVRLPGGRSVRVRSPRPVPRTVAAPGAATTVRLRAPLSLRRAVRSGGRIVVRVTARARAGTAPATTRRATVRLVG